MIIIMVPFIALLPDLTWKMIRKTFWPNPTEKILLHVYRQQGKVRPHHQGHKHESTNHGLIHTGELEQSPDRRGFVDQERQGTNANGVGNPETGFKDPHAPTWASKVGDNKPT